MREHEPKFLQHRLGRQVLRVVSGKQSSGVKIVDCPLASAACRFSRKSLSPELLVDVISQLIHTAARIVRPQAAASDMRVAPQEKNRPVLNVVQSHTFDLARDPLFHLLV